MCTAVVYALCKKDLDEVDDKHDLHWNEDVTVDVVMGSQDKSSQASRQMNGLNGITRNSYHSENSFYHSKEDAV